MYIPHLLHGYSTENIKNYIFFIIFPRIFFFFLIMFNFIQENSGQHHCCWCPSSLCCQVISSHGTDYAWYTGSCLPWGWISNNSAISASYRICKKREREIKFISLFGDRGHRGPYSPYKPCNHNLYIGMIIFPHIDNPQSTGYNSPKKKTIKIINEKSEGPIDLTNHWRKRLWISLHVDLKRLN